MKAKNSKWRNEHKKPFFISSTFSRIGLLVKLRQGLNCDCKNVMSKCRIFATFSPWKMLPFCNRLSRWCNTLNNCHLPWVMSFLDPENHPWSTHCMKRLFILKNFSINTSFITQEKHAKVSHNFSNSICCQHEAAES